MASDPRTRGVRTPEGTVAPSGRDDDQDRDADRVLGLVLCGGRSRRMGVDKGSLRSELLRSGEDAPILVERAARVLARMSDEVALATGANERYLELGRPVVLDATEGEGPAAGLAAGLRAARERGFTWLAVLACDMPAATAEPLAELLAQARSGNLDVTLFQVDGTPEPLLAVYHIRALGPVSRALRAGERRMIDFHHGFGTLRVGQRSLATEEQTVDGTQARHWMRNVNSPAEWRAHLDELTRTREDERDR